MGRRRLQVLVLGLLIVFVLAGCSAKKKKDAEEGLGAPALAEEGIAGGGSLDQFRRGTLAAAEGGPLQDIHFAFDSYELDEPSRAVLRDNADWLKTNADARVEIEGHCDERGTVEYNLALGAKRARAARDYLVALGVSTDRLTTISYGEELPLCYEHDEACWQKNRRCHFVVLGE